MKYCKVLLNGEPLFDEVLVTETFFERLKGLMFEKSLSQKPLLFKDAGWIHSFFCFIPFNALFIGKNGEILNHFSNVKKNKILPPVFGAKFTIEYLGEAKKFNDGDKIEIAGVEKPNNKRI